MIRCWEWLSVEETMAIWLPRPVSSENNSRGCLAPDSIQVSPEAFVRKSRGCPPDTGTIQVFQPDPGSLAAYAIRVLSGENLGLPLLSRLSCVSCTGSPPGRALT